MRNENGFTPSQHVPIAIVLGTNDIASAVAHRLYLDGYGVVCSRDPAQPVLRRSMAFDDALETGVAEVEGVVAYPADSLVELLRTFVERTSVSVTTMELGDLLCLGFIDVLIDARMNMRSPKVDIRPFARTTIGLGPGFTAGRHVDVAIETAPGVIGVVRDGSTLAAHGRSALLGGAGRERFARAPAAGLWLTSAFIGEGVVRGQPIGTCGRMVVHAPLSGRLRGLVRSAIDVNAEVKLAEVDPAPGQGVSWLGIAERPRAIGLATIDALKTLRELRLSSARETAH